MLYVYRHIIALVINNLPIFNMFYLIFRILDEDHKTSHHLVGKEARFEVTTSSAVEDNVSRNHRRKGPKKPDPRCQSF